MLSTPRALPSCPEPGCAVEALIFMAVRGEDKEDSFLRFSSKHFLDMPLLQKDSDEFRALQACQCAQYELVYGWLLCLTNPTSLADLPVSFTVGHNQ